MPFLVVPQFEIRVAEERSQSARKAVTGVTHPNLIKTADADLQRAMEQLSNRTGEAGLRSAS
jgi:hypothetical protein